jgi:hypothetical protein
LRQKLQKAHEAIAKRLQQVASEKDNQNERRVLNDGLVLVLIRDIPDRLVSPRKTTSQVQTEVTNGGLEDFAELQRDGARRPAINFAVATRYLHSDNSMIERRDLDQAVSLLLKVPSTLDAQKVKEISQF